MKNIIQGCKQLLKKIAVFLIMLLGTFFVFISVTLMNRFIVQQEKKITGTIIDFSVPQVNKKIINEKKQEPVSRKLQTKEHLLAPLPNIGGGNLSSIQIEMPDFFSDGLNAVSESLLGNLEDVVMTEESADTKPVVKHSTLAYPERAKQRNIEGMIIVSVLIGIDGKVKKIKILESDPPGVFDYSVLQSVPNWSFEPAKYKNRNVQVWATIPVKFNLN